MNKKLAYLRFCYWLGAILDLITAVFYFFPSFVARQFGIDPVVAPVTRFVLGHAAALMFGWTFLLIWADRDPIKRRGVLLLTVFPVIVGLLLSGIYLTCTGTVPLSRMIGSFVWQTALMIVFGSAYMVGGHLEREA